ncbi:MAG: hypothetical protein A4E71_00539 [Smithella sp. PtaU1.Bin162]|nr:MAG: hypothetical protein A4E71_00539 [Smithella sp. PtaU1.Bin162]
MSKNLNTNEETHESMATALPEFKGYTVDIRLGQFRKVSRKDNPSIEFLDFDSAEGKKLVIEYIQSLDEFSMDADIPEPTDGSCSHKHIELIGKVLGYDIARCIKCGKHFV